jgi:hypothetical protein
VSEARTDIDRLHDDPPKRPEPIMSAAEVLAELSIEHSHAPLAALEAADGHRAALVEPLLRALEKGIANPSGASESQQSRFSYALYLFAKWREPRAYPWVVRWLSLPEEEPFDIAGDVVTQDGATMLASVCQGDLEPIKALILNRRADEYGRGAGVTALALLAAWGEVPRERVVEHFLWLASEGLEREPGMVWDSLAADSADVEAVEVFPELRRAYDEGLIDPQFMHPSELDEVERTPRGQFIEDLRERHPPIIDVGEAIAWWGRLGRKEPAPVREEPYIAPPRVGRNEPCPCGSGKKYKKCCGG